MLLAYTEGVTAMRHAYLPYASALLYDMMLPLADRLMPSLARRAILIRLLVTPLMLLRLPPLMLDTLIDAHLCI